MKLIGVDVGGTFTDIVFSDTEQRMTVINKVPTTLEDPSIGVINGISDLCTMEGITKENIDHIFHGTTIATNAILEHDGAKTGMITTKGFRDITHIGRHQRPENYSIMQEIPWQNNSLIKRRYRRGVSERLVPPTGEILVPLDEEEVRELVHELKENGIESIVVSFLFSYLNPIHEERAREIIHEEYPEAFVTTSADISPQFREFERFTTAAINGFIGPKVKKYIHNLEAGLLNADYKADLHIMCSNGGVGTAESVSARPVHTLLSGPAAGVLGGKWAGGLSNKQELITFDVGGTSADIGIITEQGIDESSARDTWIAGFPVMVPMIDLHTIGAGGGSIAYIDEGGAFKVGPRSAGSRPGPACYGFGGMNPTVTDANIVLGRLDEQHFLGGAMKISRQEGYNVILELSKKLNLSVEETAEGILTIVNNNMANAIREKTIQKGHDPRDFTLVAFGGAGPLHAVEVAQILNIPEVIIPPHPGITSATGLLTTDLKYDLIKTEFMVSHHLNLERLNQDFQLLTGQILNQLTEDGISTTDIEMMRAADCRYVGQGYELRVFLPDGEITEESIQAIWDQFHQLHKSEYGHYFVDSPIEIVNIRMTGKGLMPKISHPVIETAGNISDAWLKSGKTVFRLEGELQEFDTDFYQRELLPLGSKINGPAVIFQKDTTTVMPPNCFATVESNGNITIKLGGE